MAPIIEHGRNALSIALLAASACVGCAPAAQADESAWNGSWMLDPARSSAGARDNAASGYRLTIGSHGTIRWEIPSLGEVVIGHTDGQPMVIHRSEPSPGLTLAVTAAGPYELRYQVARNGRPTGGGIMHVIEGGKAWVDVSWPAGQEGSGGELVYVQGSLPSASSSKR